MSRTVRRLGAAAAAAAVIVPVVLSTPASAQVQKSTDAAAAAVTARTAQSQAQPSAALPGRTASPLVPASTAVFTVGVKCGWWSGTVQWGGLGIVAEPAYINVSGTIFSSCNSHTYVYIRYTNGISEYGWTLFAKVGPEANAPANFYTETVAGPYGNISVRVCSNRYGWTCKVHNV